MGRQSEGCIHLAHNRAQWRDLVEMVMNQLSGCTQIREYIDYLSGPVH